MGKESEDDYVLAATHLAESIEKHGYLTAWPVPVSGDKQLLGGAHRVAAAAAFHVPEVPVVMYPEKMVWAPPWDAEWFIMAGMAEEIVQEWSEDLDRLKRGEL